MINAWSLAAEILEGTLDERKRRLRAMFIGTPTAQRRIIEERYNAEEGGSIYEDENFLHGISLYIEMFGTEDFDKYKVKKDLE